MTRSTFAIIAAIGTLSLTSLTATAGVVPVIPGIPSSALPKGQQPDMTKKNDDAEQPDTPDKIVERIASNARTAGEKLEADDTGLSTRKTQEQILKDIDALLNQKNNQSGGGGGGSSSDNQDNSGGGGSGAQGGQQSPSGSSGSNSQSGNSSGQSQQGQGGQQSKPGQQSGQGGSGRSDKPDWRQNAQARRSGESSGNQSAQQPGGQQPMPKGSNGEGQTAQQPMPKGEGKPTPAQPKDGNGETASGGLGGKSEPGLLSDDPINKDVWGHLPERVRLQMSQYYREQYVSQYGELLRAYYSSLAERESQKR